MSTRITIICENSVFMPFSLIGEHGLSILIENEDMSLFDTGQGLGILHNLAATGKDINEINRVLISHGHYDHIGGLMELLTKRKRGLPVYIEPSSFIEKIALFNSPDGPTEISIGMPHEKSEYETAGADFNLVNGFTKITDQIYAFSNITRPSGWKGFDERLKQKNGGKIIDDPFDDDMTLLVETGCGPVIICGCAHAGMIEILNHISVQTGHKEFHALIGGTHLDSVSDEYFQRTLHAFKEFNFKIIAPSHCTGFFGMKKIATEFPEKFRNASVGASFEF